MTDTVVVPNVYIQAAPPNVAVNAGDLWWNSQTGRFYIWYDDGDTQQWVSTVPVLGSGYTPAGPAGGDLDGNYPAPQIRKGPYEISGLRLADVTLTGEPTASEPDPTNPDAVSTVQFVADTVQDAISALPSIPPTRFTSVAALQASIVAFPMVYLQAYYEGGTDGGGTLVYQPGSFNPPDNGYTFAAPGGQYVRQLHGELSTDDYGILKDNTPGQGVRVQALFNKARDLRNTIRISSPSIPTNSRINCDGLTLYCNNTGTRIDPATGTYASGRAWAGMKIVTDHVRQCVLSNCVISIGQVYASSAVGTSTGNGSLSNMYVEGSIHMWNTDGIWDVNNSRVDYNGVVPEYLNDLRYQFSGGIVGYTLTVTDDHAVAEAVGSMAVVGGVSTFNVTAVNFGTLAKGLYVVNAPDYLPSDTVDAGVFITAQLSGTPGGVGTYQLSRNETVIGPTTFRIQTNIITFGKQITMALPRTTALVANPFACTTGSSILTVTHVAHGLIATNFVTFFSATAFDNYSTTNLNREFAVVGVVDADHYTIDASVKAAGTLSGGGAAVVENFGSADHCYVVNFGTGTGGAGTYTVSVSQTVATNAFMQANADYRFSWLLHGSNQASFESVKAASTDVPYRQSMGFVFDSNPNLDFNSGSTALNRGIFIGAWGFPRSAGGGNTNRISKVHGEGLVNSFIEAWRSANLTLEGNHTRGPRDAGIGKPIYAIGSAASAFSVCTGVVIEKNWIDSAAIDSPVLLDVPAADSIRIARNGFFTSQIGVRLGAQVTGFDEEVSNTNVFGTDVVTPWVRDAASGRHMTGLGKRPYLSVGAGALHFDRRRDVTVQINATNTLFVNPSPIAEGEEYTIRITKVHLADSVTWDTLFQFNGPAPTFADMLTTEAAMIYIKVVGDGTGINANCKLACRYQVLSTVARGVLQLGAYNETVVPVVITGGTATFDFSQGSMFTCTRNANIAIMALVGMGAGRGTSSLITFVGDGTARTIAWNANIAWPGGVVPTLTTTAGKRDLIGLTTVDGVNFMALINGLNI